MLTVGPPSGVTVTADDNSGRTGALVNCEGAGLVDAHELAAASAIVRLTGAGEARINAQASLTSPSPALGR